MFIADFDPAPLLPLVLTIGVYIFVPWLLFVIIRAAIRSSGSGNRPYYPRYTSRPRQDRDSSDPFDNIVP